MNQGTHYLLQVDVEYYQALPENHRQSVAYALGFIGIMV